MNRLFSIFTSISFVPIQVIRYFVHVAQREQDCSIDLFTDTAAILISIVSNSYYGMPREQIHINWPPEHPIMSFETIEIKMAAVSVKRSIGNTQIKSSQHIGQSSNYCRK